MIALLLFPLLLIAALLIVTLVGFALAAPFLALWTLLERHP